MKTPRVHNVFALFFVFSCIIATLPAPSAAFAEDAPGYSQCMDASGGVTGRMMDCEGEAIAYWDKLLNANYRKAMAACDSGDAADTAACRERLKQAQRAWMKYRDSMADFLVGGETGGSLGRLNAAGFVHSATKFQAEQLQ